MAKRSQKKRLQMQKKRPRVWADADMENIVGSLDGDQMMAWVQALAETGSYPCPACGQPLNELNMITIDVLIPLVPMRRIGASVDNWFVHGDGHVKANGVFLGGIPCGRHKIVG